MVRSSEEIKKELTEALAYEKKMKEEKAKTVKAQYVFTLTLSESNWEKVYDDTCILYRFSGHLTNREELASVNKSFHSDGSMIFIFNTLSGRLVMGVGGGTIFVSDPECYKELNQFLVHYPAGGDVTNIVNKYRN